MNIECAFFLVNSADTDEMPCSVAFHLGYSLYALLIEYV